MTDEDPTNGDQPTAPRTEDDAWFARLETLLREAPLWDADQVTEQLRLTRGELDRARSTRAIGSSDLSAEDVFGEVAAYASTIIDTPPVITDPIVGKRWFFLLCGIVLGLGAFARRLYAGVDAMVVIPTLASVVLIVMFFWGTVRLRSRRHS